MRMTEYRITTNTTPGGIEIKINGKVWYIHVTVLDALESS